MTPQEYPPPLAQSSSIGDVAAVVQHVINELPLRAAEGATSLIQGIQGQLVETTQGSGSEIVPDAQAALETARVSLVRSGGSLATARSGLVQYLVDIGAGGESCQATHDRVDTAEAHVITAESFPFPDRADTFARPLSEGDQRRLEGLRRFAGLQAAAANKALETLAASGATPTVEDWSKIYQSLTDWRSGLNAAHFGKGVVQGKDRITTPITDASPNRDRIGAVGRLRANSQWSDEAQSWVGGEQTPSSRVAERAGERVTRRFDAEAPDSDELQNIVRLPDGTAVNGNKIVRGRKAAQIAQEIKQGVAARGHDVSQFDTGGDMMFTVTATEADRTRIFAAAMDRLQELSSLPKNEITDKDLAEVVYLLYQSPLNKKGSDAVTRPYYVVAGKYLQGKAPAVPQDIDLRAYTMSQDQFVQYMIS